MNHSVSDFIIRIKNASLARRKYVVIPYSKMNKELGSALKKEHFISVCKEEMIEGRKVLSITLLYEDRDPAVTNVSIVSKPSLRVYRKAHSVRRGIGIGFLSTSLGIMTEKEAKKKGVGGELLFTVW